MSSHETFPFWKSPSIGSGVKYGCSTHGDKGTANPWVWKWAGMGRHGSGGTYPPSVVCQVADGSLLVGKAMVSVQFILTVKGWWPVKCHHSFAVFKQAILAKKTVLHYSKRKRCWITLRTILRSFRLCPLMRQSLESLCISHLSGFLFESLELVELLHCQLILTTKISK